MKIGVEYLTVKGVFLKRLFLGGFIMTALTIIEEVELAVKIGDNSQSVRVVGKTKTDTKNNILRLFASNDRNKRNRRSKVKF